MQPPDQPAPNPGEPNPVPPQVPPIGEPAASAPPPYPEAAGGTPSKEEKTWAMAAHLSSLAGYLLVPLGNVIAPLIIWLIKKDTMPFVDDQAKESLNFQITLTIAALIGLVLLAFCVGGIILAAVWVAGLVLTIVGGVKANDGVKYRYPFALRLIK
jgi:uncharacterized protein